MGSVIFSSTSSLAGGITANSSSIFGGLVGSGSNTSQNSAAVSAQMETILSAGGTYSNYSVYAVSNSRTTNSVCSLAINGTSSALTVTFGSGIFGTLQDATHTVSTAQDDANSELVVTSTGGGALVIPTSAINFAATSGTTISVSFILKNGVTYSGTGPITDFTPLSGAGTGSTIEVDQQFSNPVAGTAKYFQMYSSVNGRGTTTVNTFRVNGASGNQTLSFGAGITGSLKDTTHTDTIAAADKIAAQVALGTGTGNFTLTACGFYEDTTNVGESATSNVRNRTLAAGATTYNVIGGVFNPSATEANMTGAMGTAGTASKLWVRVPAAGNASTTNSTVKFRKGSANGNQVVTVTALTAGDYQDTTNSDSFIGTDLIDYQFDGATTGAVTYTALSMLFSVAASTFLASRPLIISQAVNRASTY